MMDRARRPRRHLLVCQLSIGEPELDGRGEGARGAVEGQKFKEPPYFRFDRAVQRPTV